MNMTIYCITNLINGKRYVGQTIRCLDERWTNHCSKTSGCTALKGAIAKYGKENFSIEYLDSASTQSELDEKERYWILKLNTLSPNGYNLKTGGEHPHLTNEVIEKISKSNLGKIVSEETKILISQRMKEQWQNGSRKGHPVSEKSKYVLAEYVKENGSWNKGLPKEQSHLYGKSKPKEQREKIAKSLSKPILCVELNKVFRSSQDACKELGVNYCNISRCLHGRSKSAGGYHWRWVE